MYFSLLFEGILTVSNLDLPEKTESSNSTKEAGIVTVLIAPQDLKASVAMETTV